MRRREAGQRVRLRMRALVKFAVLTSMLSAGALCGVAPSRVIAQEGRAGPPQVGPANGSLVIVGGNLQSPEIYKRFIDLAGGPDAKIVIIPTAGGAPTYDKYYQALDPWRDNGAHHLVLLHTYDRKVADSDEFVAALLSASLRISGRT